MLSPTSNSPKRGIATICGRVGAAIGFGFISLFLYFCAVGPEHANAATGEIYRFHLTRGRFHETFHTKQQVIWLAILGSGALTFILIGSALGWPFSGAAYEEARATYEKQKSND